MARYRQTSWKRGGRSSERPDMNRRQFIATLTTLTASLSGCVDSETSDYSDAPERARDGSLDYDDYKEMDCPHLDGSLDHETIQQCETWAENQ